MCRWHAVLEFVAFLYPYHRGRRWTWPSDDVFRRLTQIHEYTPEHTQSPAYVTVDVPEPKWKERYVEDFVSQAGAELEQVVEETVRGDVVDRAAASALVAVGFCSRQIGAAVRVFFLVGFPQNCTAASASTRYARSTNCGTTVSGIAEMSVAFSRVLKAFVDRWNCIGAAIYCSVLCRTIACSQMVDVGIACAGIIVEEAHEL